MDSNPSGSSLSKNDTVISHRVRDISEGSLRVVYKKIAFCQAFCQAMPDLHT